MGYVGEGDASLNMTELIYAAEGMLVDRGRTFPLVAATIHPQTWLGER